MSLELTRSQLRRIFKKHPGAMGGVASDLGITPQAVSQWLRGKADSQRVEEALRAKARDLVKRDGKAA